MQHEMYQAFWVSQLLSEIAIYRGLVIIEINELVEK